MTERTSRTVQVWKPQDGGWKATIPNADKNLYGLGESRHEAVVNLLELDAQSVAKDGGVRK